MIDKTLKRQKKMIINNAYSTPQLQDPQSSISFITITF